MKPTIITDDNLVYAAYSRCPCGAGLAYIKEGTLTVRAAKELGRVDYWDCSDILKGVAIPKDQSGSKRHTGQMPFVFWEVKSEGEHSAYGATTRPNKET